MSVDVEPVSVQVGPNSGNPIFDGLAREHEALDLRMLKEFNPDQELAELTNGGYPNGPSEATQGLIKVLTDLLDPLQGRSTEEVRAALAAHPDRERLEDLLANLAGNGHDALQVATELQPVPALTVVEDESPTKADLARRAAERARLEGERVEHEAARIQYIRVNAPTKANIARRQLNEVERDLGEARERLKHLIAKKASSSRIERARQKVQNLEKAESDATAKLRRLVHRAAVEDSYRTDRESFDNSNARIRKEVELARALRRQRLARTIVRFMTEGIREEILESADNKVGRIRSEIEKLDGARKHLIEMIGLVGPGHSEYYVTTKRLLNIRRAILRALFVSEPMIYAKTRKLKRSHDEKVSGKTGQRFDKLYRRQLEANHRLRSHYTDRLERRHPVRDVLRAAVVGGAVLLLVA